MILLVGSTGYIGQAFVKELHQRNVEFCCVSHQDVRPLFPCEIHAVVNCAAYIPKPSVSLCDQHPEQTVRGNLIFPIELARMCELAKIPFVTITTGCLYDEQREYSETDPPLRGFDTHCGMYVGTKLLAEEMVSKFEKHYILRIRLPFDQFDNDRNYLSKIRHYPQVYDHVNSLTHRGDFARATLDLLESRAPFGIYHMANEGSISAREIITLFNISKPTGHYPEFVPGPCKGTRLSIKKLLSTGVKMRHVNEAVEESIKNWKK